MDRRRLHFSAPAAASIVAVVAVAVVAAMLLFGPRGLFGIGLGPQPTSTPSIEVTAAPTSAPSATATSAPTPLPTPSPTVMPTPTAPVVAEWTGLSWSDPVPEAGIQIYDVVEWDGTFLAAGHVYPDDTGAILSSVDGLTWEPVQAVDPGFDRMPRLLVETEDRLLAFSFQPGHDTPGIADLDNGAPLIWESTDGVSWTEVDSPSWRMAWSDAVLYNVAHGPAGFVAIGTSYGMAGATNVPHYPIDASDNLVGSPRVYRSQDGLTWSPAQLPNPDGQVLRGIVSTAEGYVVVGGTEVAYGPLGITAGTPTAWHSLDGAQWAVSVLETQPSAPAAFTSVAVGATGMAAIAWDADAPHTWASTDGRSWQQLDGPSGSILVGNGTHAVLLGRDPDHEPGDASWPYAGIWYSTDGAAWRELPMTGTMPDSYLDFWVVNSGIIGRGREAGWFATALSP